jgi:hypothetical protein
LLLRNNLGQLLNLWVVGGKGCINSRELETALEERIGRCAANLSHNKKKKNNTAVAEIIDPILATKLKVA